MADTKENQQAYATSDMPAEVEIDTRIVSGDPVVPEDNSDSGSTISVSPTVENEDGSCSTTVHLTFAEDGTYDDEALTEALLGVITDFADEIDADNAETAVGMIVSKIGYRNHLVAAETSEEIEKAIIDWTVRPTIETAVKTNTPVEILSIFMGYNRDDIEQGISEAVAGEDITQEQADELDRTRMEQYLIEVLAESTGNEAADAALNDVRTYFLQERSGNLPKAPVSTKKLNFFTRCRIVNQCLKKQVEMLRSIGKNIKTLGDLEVWYSRYAYGAPLEMIKETGYAKLFRYVAPTSKEEILKDCVRIARELGYQDAGETSFDYENISRAMRAYCVNKTGYSYPMNWLYAMGLAEHNAPKR